MKLGDAIIAYVAYSDLVLRNKEGVTCETIAAALSHIPQTRRIRLALFGRINPQDVNAAISGFNNRNRNPWRRRITDGEPLPNTAWEKRRWKLTEAGRLYCNNVITNFETRHGVEL